MALGRFLILLLVAPSIFAAITVHEFQDPADELRYRTLTEELRCPKCQNQNIADSNAPLSEDLRQKVYDMILEGRNNGEIVAYLTARYGDFITYRPPLKPSTWLLWFGPIAIILVIAIGLGIWVRKRGREAAPELSEQDRERLNALLENHGENR